MSNLKTFAWTLAQGIRYNCKSNNCRMMQFPLVLKRNQVINRNINILYFGLTDVCGINQAKDTIKTRRSIFEYPILQLTEFQVFSKILKYVNTRSDPLQIPEKIMDTK